MLLPSWKVCKHHKLHWYTIAIHAAFEKWKKKLEKIYQNYLKYLIPRPIYNNRFWEILSLWGIKSEMKQKHNMPCSAPFRSVLNTHLSYSTKYEPMWTQMFWIHLHYSFLTCCHSPPERLNFGLALKLIFITW